LNRKTVLVVLHLLVILATLTFVGCGGGTSLTKNAKAAAPVPGQPAPNATPGSTTSATPTGGTTLDHLEEGNWLTCGACGNDHATGAVAGSAFQTGVGSPSTDGSSTQFTVTPTAPYSNAYWWEEHTPISGQINSLRYEFDLYVPASAAGAPQAIEFECQQQLSGWVYNFAWQANYVEHSWKIFNYGAAAWDASGVPFSAFAPGTWHHIIAEFHDDTTNHVVIHDALTVDGTRYALGIHHNAFSAPSFADKFTNAFQLDTNSASQAYSVYVDAMRVTYN
jgi:hypothetical protein